MYVYTYIVFRSTTIFNLSPRGHGRASFRLSEIVQIGRIPVMIYDDFPWIPYDYPNSGMYLCHNTIYINVDYRK